MAAENPDETWLQFDPNGDRPEGVEDRSWHGLIWRAWEALHDDRFYGAMGGEGAIYYASISRYASDHGIAGEDFLRFHKMLTAVDHAWRLKRSEEREAKQKEGE